MGRPVDGNKRLTPDMWLEYRKRHKFQGPNCLCPLLQTTKEEPPHTEAEIMLKGSGNHVGEYIAECPNGRCEYFGQLPLEQKYPLYGIPVDGRAAHIEKGNIVTPEQVLAMPSTGNSRPLKRTTIR